MLLLYESKVPIQAERLLLQKLLIVWMQKAYQCNRTIVPPFSSSVFSFICSSDSLLF